ncbi:hypothetical protein GCM10009835_17770 [Planosporangium flavigriseum]
MVRILWSPTRADLPPAVRVSRHAVWVVAVPEVLRTRRRRPSRDDEGLTVRRAGSSCWPDATEKPDNARGSPEVG